MRNFLTKGEMGRSFIYSMPVTDIILERLPLSLAFTFAAFALTWIIAVPLGIYSAVRQYSLTDYLATTMSFIGLAVPNFLLALGLALPGIRQLPVMPLPACTRWSFATRRGRGRNWPTWPRTPGSRYS